MPSISKTEGLNAKNMTSEDVDVEDINVENNNNVNVHGSYQQTKLHELLKQREQSWWQVRQELINLKERKMVWYGENSLMMWLLWQLVSYVIVAMVLMLLNNFLSISLPLWQYIGLFVLQTVIFVVMLTAKGRNAHKLQRKIDKDELVREEAFNEMVILAEDSLYLDVHVKSPISLRQLYEYYDAQFHLSSLQWLLKREIDAGRLMLDEQHLEASILPLELADDELDEHASQMIYKSLI